MAVSKQLSPAKYTLLDSTKLHSVAMVTNEMVLNLHSIISHNSDYTYCTLRQWLLELFGKNFQEKDFPSAKAIRQNILRLCGRLSKLKKEKTAHLRMKKFRDFYRKNIACHKYSLVVEKFIKYPQLFPYHVLMKCFKQLV